MGLTERPSSAADDRRPSDIVIFGATGLIQNLLFLERKVRSSCRVLRDASNELAYTIYIGITSVTLAAPVELCTEEWLTFSDDKVKSEKN
jgi:hypothetical protein